MKEKEINLPYLCRFKSSRLCFFSPLKILQVTELAADVSSLKHELTSSSMKTLSILLKGPAAKQGDEKLVYRLIQLFPSTEIFSKRRKICALWRKTRVICKFFFVFEANGQAPVRVVQCLPINRPSPTLG